MLVSALHWMSGGLLGAGLALVVNAVFSARSQELQQLAWATYAVGFWVGLVAELLEREPSPVRVAIDGALGAFYTWLWWKGRRKGRGRKVLKALGEKSRARVQALVDQMTPSPIPSPAGGA